MVRAFLLIPPIAFGRCSVDCFGSLYIDGVTAAAVDSVAADADAADAADAADVIADVELLNFGFSSILYTSGGGGGGGG